MQIVLFFSECKNGWEKKTKANKKKNTGKKPATNKQYY